MAFSTAIYVEAGPNNRKFGFDWFLIRDCYWGCRHKSFIAFHTDTLIYYREFLR